MARACEICAKKTAFGNTRSWSNNSTRRSFKINLQPARVLGMRVKLCSTCRRTLNKPARMAPRYIEAVREAV